MPDRANKERADSALLSMAPPRDYDTWKNIGISYKAAGGDLDTFLRWSAGDPEKYDEATARKLFGNVAEDGKITAGTLFYHARLAGWNDGTHDAGVHLKKPDDMPKPLDLAPTEQTVAQLEALFMPGENVNVSTRARWSEKQGKWTPADGGTCYERDELIDMLREGRLDEVLDGYEPEAGVWICQNPTDGRGRGKDRTVQWRHALIESDDLPVDEQVRIMRELDLPITTMTTSGGKSVHALVRVDAEGPNHYAERVQLLHDICNAAGLKVDRANKDSSRLTRLAGVQRGEQYQTLLYANIGADDFQAWADTHRPDKDDAQHGNARDRYRKRGGALLHNVLARDLIEEEHACVFIGSPAIWNGSYWEFGPDAVKRACTARLDDIRQREQAEVYNYIKTNAQRVDESSFSGGYYVAFSDCTVDLSTLETVEPCPEMLITGRISARWAPSSKPGYADKFIEAISDGDGLVARALLEVVGSCMCSRRMTSQAAFCIGRANVQGGEASNGKSTYMNAIRNMLGPAVTCNVEPRLMGQRFGLSSIVGKSANIADDISGKSLDGDTLAVFRKTVTGYPVRVDVKMSDAFDYVSQAQSVFSMNEIPHPKEANEGFFRRCAFIPFRRKFTPEDADIHVAQRMTEPENMDRLAYLGAAAAHVMLREKRDTFTRIPGMEVELETLREESDTVLAWTVNEGIERDYIVGKTIADLHVRYKGWCLDSGSHGVSRSKFTRRMNQLFLTESTSEYNPVMGKSVRCFGLKVKDS